MIISVRHLRCNLSLEFLLCYEQFSVAPTTLYYVAFFVVQSKCMLNITSVCNVQLTLVPQAM
jgi:hypothetical protein